MEYENDKIVEKEISIEDMHKSITDGAIAGDADAYAAYGRIEKKLADNRVAVAKAEIASVMAEFNAIIAKDIKKSDDESDEAQASRIWIENDDLYIRISEAQRILDDLRGDA